MKFTEMLLLSAFLSPSKHNDDTEYYQPPKKTKTYEEEREDMISTMQSIGKAFLLMALLVLCYMAIKFVIFSTPELSEAFSKISNGLF